MIKQNILGAAAVAAGTAGLLRTGMADQVEKMTPAERLDYLQQLLTLATNPAGGGTAATDTSGGAAQDSSSGESSGTSPTSDTATKTDDTSSTDSKPAESVG